MTDAIATPPTVTSDTIEIPMPLPSLANSRGHSKARGRVIAKQRSTVALALRALMLGPLRDVPLAEVPLTITLVRVSPRALDAGDNLGASLKGVRDEVAAFCGYRDDSRPNLRWRYEQAVDGRPKYQAARITITVGHYDCPHCKQAMCGPEGASE